LVGFRFMRVRHFYIDAIALDRSFYGVMHIEETGVGDDRIRTLYHGLIQHGNQYLDAERRKEPTTYYAHTSGAGLALDLCCDKRPRRAGFIGVGAGTLAAYCRAGAGVRVS